ncbi:hypothetical protein ACKKBF_B19575 [Auxenochlorella protothecoides x Auxenochlorella symbiontica]
MARVPIAVLAACMLFTGSLFTIVLKLQDTEVVGHRPDGTPITFRHPALQTACMFAGEALCLIPHFIWRWSRRGVRTPTDRAASDARHRAAAWAFGLPALCDAGGTTMLNLGLYYTSASACQMLRGTLVVFAGLLTITVLKRKLYAHHWAGITLICAGAALVGASSILYADGRAPARQGSPGLAARAGGKLLALLEAVGVGHHNTSAPNPLLGNLLVILAQLLAACQFIGEEKLLTQHRAPVLLAAGVEGAWGLAIAALALPLLSVVRGRGGEPLDSLPDALRALRASPRLQWTTAAAVASIGAFNFFGVSVTKNLSGGSRAAIDACRTLFVWLFSLWAGWERAHVLQLVGFVVLISGTSVYNEILRSCLPGTGEEEPGPAQGRRTRGQNGSEASGDLEDPLLGLAGPSAGAEAARRPAGPAAPAATPGIRTGRPPRPARPLRTMARSVTILPAALSPHSLASPSGRGGGALGASTASVSVLASSVSATALAEESGGSDGEGEPARWQPSPGRSRRGEYGRTP